MATELEGNIQLQHFIELLANLNHQSVEMIKNGDMSILEVMGETIEEMLVIQRAGEEDAYTAIEEEMQIALQNFNAIVAMIQSNETETPDEATVISVKKFLHNIFEATVSIITKYGLV